MKPPPLSALGVCLSALFVIANAAAATSPYLETFDSATYKDAVNTTANWNTGAGELALFPFVPTLAGSYDTPGTARSVAIDGDFAFVADGVPGVHIMDISNPGSPSLIATFDTPNFAIGVTIDGDYAYVADNGAGLVILDITNPAVPLYLGAYDTPGLSYSVAVSGDLAVVADFDGGLQVIDVSSPASPSLLGTYATPGFAFGVALSGDLVVVASSSAVLVIDVSNPAAPTLLGTYAVATSTYGVTVDGDQAWVAGGSAGLLNVDISDPTLPVLAGFFNTPGIARGVAVDGDLALIADGASGLIIVDISNVAAPVLVGQYDAPGDANGVTVDGDLALVTDHPSGLQAVTVRELIAPTLAGGYDTPSLAARAAVVGGHAFVVDYEAGLQIFDVRNPSAPVLVGAVDTPGFALAVAVSGDLAFVTDWGSGLQIIDIRDLTSPVIIGTYATAALAEGVAVAGDYAFVAADSLEVIDVSDPTMPTLAGSYPGTARHVTIAGDVAVLTGFDHLTTLDISNPATPTLLGVCSIAGFGRSSVVAGNFAFVAAASGGLHIIDITQPSTPTQVGNYDAIDSASGVAVAGNRAFVVDNGDSLIVLLNVSNPASPALETSYAWPTSLSDVALAGDRILVTGVYDGIQIIQVSQHDAVTESNVGQSLVVDGADDTIIRAHLASTETAGVAWQLSANGGTSWEGTSNHTWKRFSSTGADLLWRSTLMWLPAVTPSVSDLTIEWRNDFAPIASIVDVPNDQGGRVHLHLTRSGYDFADETAYPVTLYGIYRRIDDAALSARVASLLERGGGSEPDAALRLPGTASAWHNGTHYVRGGSATAAFPPGLWALVMSVPATQSDSYLVEVATAADSSETGSNHAVYLVTTHTTTPSVWFVCRPDSGYSLDNLAPSVPANFVVSYNTGSGNTLAWDESPDADLRYFNVYRSPEAGFLPSPATLVHSTTTPGWTDPSYDGWSVHYQVTAVDFAGNESSPAGAITTGVGGERIPRSLALHANVPNPFNPTTLIRYDVPEGAGIVTLTIYDVRGSVVRTLVNGTQSAGERSVLWDGLDNAGNPVSSGVFFCRMQAAGFAQSQKMVLLK